MNLYNISHQFCHHMCLCVILYNSHKVNPLQLLRAFQIYIVTTCLCISVYYSHKAVPLKWLSNFFTCSEALPHQFNCDWRWSVLQATSPLLQGFAFRMLASMKMLCLGQNGNFKDILLHKLMLFAEALTSIRISTEMFLTIGQTH